jgi:hypothetical protein
MEITEVYATAVGSPLPGLPITPSMTLNRATIATNAFNLSIDEIQIFQTSSSTSRPRHTIHRVHHLDLCESIACSLGL